MGLRLRRKRANPVPSGEENEDGVKVAKPVKKMPRFFKKILNSPNFEQQLLIIIFTLASDAVPMDRRIDTMASSIDKVRNLTEMINATMKTLKTASEVPKQMRRLLE